MNEGKQNENKNNISTMEAENGTSKNPRIF